MLANLGGVIGLFLGMSIVSIIEFLVLGFQVHSFLFTLQLGNFSSYFILFRPKLGDTRTTSERVYCESAGKHVRRENCARINDLYFVLEASKRLQASSYSVAQKSGPLSGAALKPR
jgi:hypothetical protein